MSDASEVNRFNPRPLTNVGGRTFGVRYPSPFFDVAQQFLPENVHQLHLWCRYYFLTNPIINVAVSKMAEYPVTPLIFDTEDESRLALYRGIEDQLNLRQFQVETGLDFFAYGISFTSLYYPLEKFLICQGCRTFHRAKKSRGLYKWKNMRFRLRCPKCNHEGDAEERDVYIRSARDIGLVRWNPENMELKYNEITGKTQYFYKIPKGIINDVKLGDPETIETLPLSFLDAVRKNRALLFRPDNLFVLKRPSIAQKDMGWGTPLMYSVLKDAFYLQVLKKANEAIAMEHIVPLRVVFPGPASGGSDQPYGTYNLQNWKAKIDSELNLWKRDPNYIPIFPVNVGFQQWGGNAKALVTHQEYRFLAEQMLAGMGIPVEFIFGGLQWSGTNTSLRALENMFSGYNRQRHALVNEFIYGKIAAYMGWPRVNVRFDRFKMADDLQRSMFMLQLNQAQKISDRRLMEELGESHDREIERMDEELKRQLKVQRKMQTASAEVQGEAALRTGRYQAKVQAMTMMAQGEAQQAMQAAGMQPQPQPGQEGQAASPADPSAQPQEGAEQQIPGTENIPGNAENASTPNKQKLPTAVAAMGSYLGQGQGGVDMTYIAQRAASYIRTLSAEQGEDNAQQELQRITAANPVLGQMTRQLMDSNKGNQVDPLNAAKAPIPAGGSQRGPGRAVG